MLHNMQVPFYIGITLSKAEGKGLMKCEKYSYESSLTIKQYPLATIIVWHTNIINLLTIFVRHNLQFIIKWFKAYLSISMMRTTAGTLLSAG
jgi:hypothetical protein